MKKTILSVMACAFCAFSFAQQGTFEVGGSIGISNNNPNSLMERTGNYEKKFSVSVLPSFMYNVSDKVAIGTGIGFLYSKDGEDTKTSEFVIQPTIRYSIPITENFSYTPQFYVGLGFGSINFDDEDTLDPDIFEMGAGFNLVRFQYNISDCMGLSFSCGNLSYQYTKLKADDIKAENNKFEFGLNLEPTLGFYYKF